MEQATMANVPIRNFRSDWSVVFLQFSQITCELISFYIYFNFIFFFSLILSLFITPMVQWKIEISWTEESLHFTPWRLSMMSFFLCLSLSIWLLSSKYAMEKFKALDKFGIEGKGYDMKCISIEIHWKLVRSGMQFTYTSVAASIKDWLLNVQIIRAKCIFVICNIGSLPCAMCHLPCAICVSERWALNIWNAIC